MKSPIYTVSDSIALIKETIVNAPVLSKMMIEGELSNVTKHRSGHWYFTLKDAHARLSCVMFASYAQTLSVDFKEGDKVVVLGSISVYEASGSLQCYVTAMQLAGLGDLYKQLELSRKKLAEAGIFNDEHKHAIPKYPLTIGLITSNKSAAYYDVISTLKRRWPIAQVKLYASSVQGNDAKLELVKAISLADQANCDVILLVRGGGSIEDLWSFNEESVVMAIYNAKTPIISGVGHQSDITLVDHVSDLRAPTPTGAAELATPDLAEVTLSLTKIKSQLITLVNQKLQLQKQALKGYKQSKVLTDPTAFLQPFRLQLMMIEKTLDYRVERFLLKKQELQQQKQQINRSMMLLLQQKQQALSHLKALHQTYNSEHILAKGYSIAKIDGKIIESIKDVKLNQKLSTTFIDGVIESDIIMIKEQKDE